MSYLRAVWLVFGPPVITLLICVCLPASVLIALGVLYVMGKLERR